MTTRLWDIGELSHSIISKLEKSDQARMTRVCKATFEPAARLTWHTVDKHAPLLELVCSDWLARRRPTTGKHWRWPCARLPRLAGKDVGPVLPEESFNWNLHGRLKQYASFVSVWHLQIDTSIVPLLWTSWPATLIFPNVRSISLAFVCYEVNISSKIISSITSPDLKNLHLFFPRHIATSRLPLLPTLISAIATSNIQLSEICITMEAVLATVSIAHALSELATFIDGQTTLKAFTLQSDNSATHPLLNAASRKRGLRELTTSYQNHESFNTTGGFHDITHVKVEVECGQDVESFIPQILSTVLESLDISTGLSIGDALKDVVRFTALKDIKVVVFLQHMYFEDLLPLLFCRQLEVVVIEADWLQGLDDDAVSSLGLAWPRLRILRLPRATASLRVPTEPGVTVRALEMLSIHCPSLQELGIAVGFRSLNTSHLRTLTNVAPSMKNIRLAGSVVGGEHQQDIVARYIVAMWPNLRLGAAVDHDNWSRWGETGDWAVIYGKVSALSSSSHSL